MIYDDTQSTEAARLTVAHELGHIFLGHELTCAEYRAVNQFDKKAKSEKQADMFAHRLLCPACVLWGMELRAPKDIARVSAFPNPWERNGQSGCGSYAPEAFF